MEYQVRFAAAADEHAIYNLYKQVAMNEGGIARNHHEITTPYIHHNLHKAILNGVSLVVINPRFATEIFAEIHCYRPEPAVFAHILSDLTIVVHPAHQSQGLGKLLFTRLLDHVETHCTDIIRIELIARESNKKAIAFYQKLGFKTEGRLENRIRNTVGDFEADIPMAWFNKNFKLV